MAPPIVGSPWHGGRRAAAWLRRGYFPRTQEITLDGPVLWCWRRLTVASALLFGLIPALHGTGGPVDDSLRSLGRSSTGSVAVRRLRRVLVGSQFAIATPLLVVAGLLLASLNELQRVDLGFDSHNVLTGAVACRLAQYTEPGRVAAFWDELQQRVESVPGRVGGGVCRRPAAERRRQLQQLRSGGVPDAAGAVATGHAVGAVTPEYFRVLGLSLSKDASSMSATRCARTRVVVVDRAWARRFFPERERHRQAVPGRRLHELPVDDRRRRRQRSEVRGPGQAGRGNGLYAMAGRGRLHRGRLHGSVISCCARTAIRRGPAGGAASRSRAGPERALYRASPRSTIWWRSRSRSRARCRCWSAALPWSRSSCRSSASTG